MKRQEREQQEQEGKVFHKTHCGPEDIDSATHWRIKTRKQSDTRQVLEKQIFQREFAQHQEKLFTTQQEDKVLKQIAKAIQQEEETKKKQQQEQAQLFRDAWVEQIKIKHTDDELNEQLLRYV